ncbi:hypothetical protein BD414DRAFT_531085 [Trametes punicea]|nr:hypothetical protein BD414DRAFT_531085 [Trametes punicea]
MGGMVCKHVQEIGFGKSEHQLGLEAPATLQRGDEGSAPDLRKKNKKETCGDALRTSLSLFGFIFAPPLHRNLWPFVATLPRSYKMEFNCRTSCSDTRGSPFPDALSYQWVRRRYSRTGGVSKTSPTIARLRVPRTLDYGWGYPIRVGRKYDQQSTPKRAGPWTFWGLGNKPQIRLWMPRSRNASLAPRLHRETVPIMGSNANPEASGT